jgi:iron complex outermembrane receptor protein
VVRDGNDVVRPTPESELTKAYDIGWRLNHPRTIASVAVYYIDYQNRIVSTFNEALGYSEDRNVGDVEVKGLDAQLGRRFGELLTLSASAAYNESTLAGSLDPTLDGKQLVETPKWTFAARMDLQATANLYFGLQAKRVGDRYGTDNNDEIAPAYTVVDLDAAWKFQLPGFDAAQLRFNVINLLDEEYFGNISSGRGGTSVAFYSIGAPRTVSASLVFDF